MSKEAPLLAVVDDDADVRVALTRLAASAGLDVEAFGSGAEFLRSILDHEPDCLVLDLHMPEMNGFDLQAALAKSRSTIPVVVITGRDTEDARERALQLGASDYLPKPVDHEALLAAIEVAMSARRPPSGSA
jgi:FixJ family two-component response regulator